MNLIYTRGAAFAESADSYHHNIISSGHKKAGRICHIKLYIYCFLFMLILFPSQKTQAAVLKVRYHDTTYSYTGTQAGVIIDGTSVDLGNCPGLIVDNTLLLPLEEVFKDSLGAEAAYDSASGEICISGFGNEIIMYLDSTKAYVNGEQQKLSTVPLSVKYVKASETRILVPARSAVEALGFTYIWNSSKKQAEITRPFQIYYDGKWINYEDIQGKVSVDNQQISLGKMPAIQIDSCMMVPVKKVFASKPIGMEYQYEEDTKQVILTGTDFKITLTADSTEVLINDTKKEAPTAPKTVINGYNNIEYFLVPIKFLSEQMGYYYTWNSSSKTVEIFTSEHQMLDVMGYYFSEECTQETADYSNSAPEMESSYSLEGTGKNTSITGIFYNENTIAYGERYIISADQAFSEISSVFDNITKQILITCKNADSADTSYTFENPVIQGASTSYDSSTGTTTITLQSAAEKLNYHVGFSQDGSNLYVDIYENCITSIIAKKQGNQELLSITGAFGLQNSYYSADNVLTITFPFTFRGITSEMLSSDDSSFIKNVTLAEQEDKSLMISVSYEGGYYIQASDSSFQVIFYGSGNGDDSENEDIGDFDIYIPLPSDVSYEDITDHDPYADKKFQLLIPGDYLSFYEKNTILSNNADVNSINIGLNSTGKKTVITVKTAKIRGYRFYDAGNALGIFIGSPKKMYQNIVLLDAGHGGKDSGAVHGGYKEKDFNLTILYKKMKQYFNQSGNIKAYWTRANDTFIDLYERPKLSAKSKADIFISLHMNSASSSSAKGLEVYYSEKNTSKSSSGLTSKLMASFFQDSLISKIGCYDRGYKSANYVVVKYNTVPSVLIELGFITNSSDLARLRDNEKQTKAAKAIYNTIVELFEEYPTGR